MRKAQKAAWTGLLAFMALFLLAVVVRTATFVDVGPDWLTLYLIFSWTFPLSILWLVLFSVIALWQIYRLFSKTDMPTSEWLLRLSSIALALLNVFGWTIATSLLP